MPCWKSSARWRTLIRPNVEIQAQLALAYVARGDLSKAKSFLSPETAGANPALWMTMAEIELRGNRLAEGKTAVMQAMRLDATRRRPPWCWAASWRKSNADAGYQPIEAVADAALVANDFAAAAVALHEFTTRVPSHLIALMRLVEICVDGGLESTMYEAQAQLAEAYLESGRALEARIISEDLVAREPWNKANIDRFRRALVMLGEGDPDAIIADRLSGESPFLATEKMDLNEGVSFEAAPKAATPPAAAAPAAEKEPDQDRKGMAKESASIEIDVSDALSAPAASKPLPLVPPPPRSLDQVFRGIRDESSRGSSEEAAAEAYRLALTYHEMDMTTTPSRRSKRRRGRRGSGSTRRRCSAACISSARTPNTPSSGSSAPPRRRRRRPMPGRALLYDLAKELESVGEHSRALAVFVELESESGGYRDVAGRIERLSKVQARG